MATRNITAGVLAELTKSHVRMGLLAKLEFDSGDTKVHSGVGDLVFDGETYTGVGILGGVSPIVETQEIRATGVTLTLSGVPEAMAALVLAEDCQKRPASMWLAFFDVDDNLIADPYKILTGQMNYMNFTADGDSSTVEVLIENALIDLNKTDLHHYTDANQKITYPNDEGLSFVSVIQDKEITWGVNVE